MNEVNSKKVIVDVNDFKNHKEMTSLALTNTMFILSGGVFKDFTKLEEVYFGLDITRIGHGTFEGCTALKDVWFAIVDKDKIIEIADDAFRGCSNVTFHIFASAIDNKYLNDYATKHGFRVVGML